MMTQLVSSIYKSLEGGRSKDHEQLSAINKEYIVNQSNICRSNLKSSADMSSTVEDLLLLQMHKNYISIYEKKLMKQIKKRSKDE